MLEILVPPGRIPLVGPGLFIVWKGRMEDLHPSLGQVGCERWSCYEEQGISNPERGRLRLSQEKQLLLLCEVRAEERMCLLTINSRGIDSRKEKNSVNLCICQLAQCFPIVWMDYWRMLLLLEDWFSWTIAAVVLLCLALEWNTYSQVEINLVSVWGRFQIWELQGSGKGSQYSGKALEIAINWLLINIWRIGWRENMW